MSIIRFRKSLCMCPVLGHLLIMSLSFCPIRNLHVMSPCLMNMFLLNACNHMWYFNIMIHTGSPDHSYRQNLATASVHNHIPYLQVISCTHLRVGGDSVGVGG